MRRSGAVTVERPIKVITNPSREVEVHILIAYPDVAVESAQTPVIMHEQYENEYVLRLKVSKAIVTLVITVLQLSPEFPIPVLFMLSSFTLGEGWQTT